MKSNRPDIVIKDYKRKICFLIDMPVPTDSSISVKEYNEIRKFKELGIEIGKTWHCDSNSGSSEYVYERDR